MALAGAFLFGLLPVAEIIAGISSSVDVPGGMAAIILLWQADEAPEGEQKAHSVIKCNWREGWGWFASWLGAGAVLLAVHLKILTYASGQDPFTYTRLALDLLENGMSSAAMRTVAEFIIPGWPVVLAVVIRLFGPYAVSWVGFVVLWGAAAGLLRLARQWGLGPSGGLLLVWTVLLLIWIGEGLYAHFLLYAFRGAPQFFCIVWAFVLLEGADPVHKSGGIRLGLAACILLVGALMRETVLLALPGMLAWVLVAPAWKKRRWGGGACLMTPLVLMMVGAIIYILVSGENGNTQFQTWLSFLAQTDVRAYGARLREYGRLIAAAAGWPGWTLLVLGLWFQRRNPERVLLWLLSALALAAFYAVFMVHQRYVLDSYLLLTVMAAAGVAFACKAAEPVLAPRFRPWAFSALLILLLGLHIGAIQRLPVWECAIAREDIRRFDQITKRFVPERARLWTDPNCRCLVDTAWVYLNAKPMPCGQVLADQFDQEDWYYWGRAQPASSGGVHSDDHIREHADMHPILDENGSMVEASLGDVLYRLYRISPWAQRVAEQEWQPGKLPLLWLDFQESDPDAHRQVRLLTSSGTAIQRWTINRGNGLVPLVVETNRINDNMGLRVAVESTSVLPSQLIRVPEIVKTWPSFTMERGRLPSALKWVRPPAHFGRSDDKWGVGITRAAQFEFPIPKGEGSLRPVISILLEPRFRRNQEVIFHYSINRKEAVSYTNRLHRGRFRHEFPVSMPVETESIHVDMIVNIPDDWDNHFRLVSIGFQVR